MTAIDPLPADVPRSEHPRPQQRRERWISLNGAWTCRIIRDPHGHLVEAAIPGGRRLADADVGPFQTPIIVPFAPESPLSGIGTTDFMERIDYHRVLDVPAGWAGLDVLLHFGGVDFHADVFLDGRWMGAHSGGSSPFTINLTPAVTAGARHQLTVRVQDYIHAGDQAGGKQSHHGRSHGCFYTRTTGIWQSVWLEAVHPAGIADLTIVADTSRGAFIVTPRLRREQIDLRSRLRLTADGDAASLAEEPLRNGVPIVLPVSEPRLWWPEDPFLYDLELEVIAGDTVLDRVESYAGLRETGTADGRCTLNGRPVYLRFVLDQGFYPDGIWTAPSDEALRRDIELSLAAGFNGARLHQKVFEDRFHYWADRLGYLTWSEWPNWGLEHNSARLARTFLTEVREVVTHLRNHPSIIAWTPYNETGRITHERSHHLNHVDAYELCRAVDPTRPVNDSSGYIHHRTDLYTVHTYAATGHELADRLVPEATPGTDRARLAPFRNRPEYDVDYDGEPYLVDEFGGIKWTGESAQVEADHDRTSSWGYGGTPRTEEEFFARLEGLVETLLATGHVAGWCYTQLTDVEQEQNGVYFYDRSEKFSAERLRAIFGRGPDGYDR